MPKFLNLDGGALFNASALPPSSPRSLRGIANNHTPARAPRKQDRDAQGHKTPAQVKGSPAVARRLGGTCEGLVNPGLDGPCVDGFPNGWVRHGTYAQGVCVDAGDDEYYDLSNSRPAEAVRQELPAGSVWGAGTTVEIRAEAAAFEELRAERRREATLRRLMDAEANAQVQREEEERLWRADAARRPATPEGWTPPADGGESDGWSD